MFLYNFANTKKYFIMKSIWKMKEKQSPVIRDWQILLLTGLLGIPIGILVGAVDTVFRFVMV